jgi:hypothetical protein
LAQDRVAIVVSSNAGAAPTESMRKDAFALSESLFGMGFSVTRLENPEAATLTRALQSIPKDATALLYFSGAARPEGTETMLVTGATPLALSATLSALQAGGRAEALMFLDACRGSFWRCRQRRARPAQRTRQAWRKRCWRGSRRRACR